MTYSVATSYTEELKAADVRYMRDLLKRGRATWAAMPDYLKRDFIRRLDDGAYIAAQEIRENGWSL